jgi:hypothetical protein
LHRPPPAAEGRPWNKATSYLERVIQSASVKYLLAGENLVLSCSIPCQ